MKLAIFSAEAKAEAVEAAKVKSAPKANKVVLWTPLNSLVLRKGAVTQTAQMDFFLVAAIAFSEDNAPHVAQVVAFAESLGYDFKSQGMTSVARIKKHIVDNKLAVVENNVIKVSPKELPFWHRAAQATSYRAMLLSFMAPLAAELQIDPKGYEFCDEEGKARFVSEAYYEECIDEAVAMNDEFLAQAAQKKASARKKARKAK